MKMLGSFCVGAFAGFLLGSTKQGCAMRKDVDNALKGLFSGEPAGKELENGTNSAEPLKREPKIKLRKQNNGANNGADYDSAKQIGAGADDADAPEAPEEAPMPIDNGPLGIDKAHELAEKLGAKVTEIKGEESLPHSHHIDIPINKLSA
jgi:hypothetical protein